MDAVAADGETARDRVVTETVSRAFADEYHRLVGLAILLTGDHGAAEDAVQDAFEVVMRRAAAEPDRLDAPVAPWLRGIVARVVQQRRRGAGREMRRLMRLEVRPERDMGMSDESLDMVAALLRLPPRMRACAVLFYIHDRATAEIAGDLGCSPRTVENNLRAAREHLRRHLGDEPGGPPHG